MGNKYDTMIGEKFHRLTYIGNTSSFFDWKDATGIFLCECFSYKILPMCQVTRGYIRSCGCLQREVTKARAIVKPHWHVLRDRWSSMKHRCVTEKYDCYFGRGIKVCDEWLNDFEKFYEDMLPGFHPDLEIDRIDNSGDYSKDNCRWVTHNENNFNKRKQTNNISGKTGVCYHNKTNKWRAYITIEGKQIHLGMFTDINEAVTARKTAELKHYGYNRP